MTTRSADAAATVYPKASLATPSDATSFACCDHVLPLYVKTYAAPASLATASLYGAPMTIVVPEIATDLPNQSFTAPSEARRAPVSLQLLTDPLNTHALPFVGDDAPS